MKLRTVFIGLFLAGMAFAPSSLLANDGVFYATGNTLVPVQETVVELSKEILKLTAEGGYMDVDVDFTFYNPGPAKSVIVGFVTPPAGGDMEEGADQHPQISGFTVNVNGEDLPFKISRFEQSGFSLEDETAFENDFIYYFEVNFKPGENKILHHYQFRGGSTVDLMRSFEYRITTGTTWANEEIGDFYLEIDMGEGTFYSVPATFFLNKEKVSWEQGGKGRISESTKEFFDRELFMVTQSEGKLKLHIEHFKPEYDIWLAEFQDHNLAYLEMENPKENPLGDVIHSVGYYAEDDLMGMKKPTLATLRNYYFARKGFVFKSEKYQKLFNDFWWYLPQEDEEILLSPREKEYIKLIQKVEAQK